MPASRKRVVPTGQLLGLCAMAWFVWVNRVDPRLAHEPLPAVLTQALKWVFVAWVSSVFVTAGVFAAVVRHRSKDQDLLAASLPGVWFAPAIILMSTLSPAGLAVGLALVLAATRWLLARWIPAGIPAKPPKARAFEIDPAFLGWSSLPALAAAAAGQAGLVALLLHYPFLAAAGFAASVAILIGHSVFEGAYQPGRPPAMPPSGMGMVLTFLLVLAATTSSIQVGVMSGSGFGSGGQLSGKDSGTSVTDLQSPPRSLTGSGGGFDGVILRPEPVETRPVIFMAPAAWNKAAVTETASTSIPFSGEYWMFQAPYRHPPPWSVVEEGKPTGLFFHTTNGLPMQMAADQKLNRPVDLTRCGGIQVVISRAGDDPALLEVILVDSQSGQWESLGTAEATKDALDFPVPASGSLNRFDEIRVVYHRPPTLGQKSARIAIERFVITPHV
ncbi:MAG TPA: hypothetical protein VIY49_33780 [Bryobacteraceae bacterium]